MFKLLFYPVYFYLDIRFRNSNNLCYFPYCKTFKNKRDQYLINDRQLVKKYFQMLKLFFKLNNNTGTNDLVVVGSGLTVNGTNSIYLTGSSPVGTNTLMTFASTNGAGTFVLGMTNPNVFLIYTATSLSLAVTNTGYTNSILTWKGYVNGQWDDAVNVNWLAGYR